MNLERSEEGGRLPVEERNTADCWFVLRLAN